MKILIPMDLSDVSLNAFDYALQRFPGATFTVLHVITGLENAKFIDEIAAGVSPEIAISRELEEIIKEHLDIEEVPSHINIEGYYGEPVHVISKYIKSHEFDCVFIGSRDKYDMLDTLFGTVSLGIIKTCNVPTFVIPKYAKYHVYQRIMVAADEHLSDPDILMALNFWNTNNAHVKFLHVENNKTGDFKKIKEAVLNDFFDNNQPLCSYEIEEVNSNNVAESLLANAYNYNADLLITIARNANFLQSLVFKSLSKDLLLKSAIPMLFLHTSKDKAN